MLVAVAVTALAGCPRNEPTAAPAPVPVPIVVAAPDAAAVAPFDPAEAYLDDDGDVPRPAPNRRATRTGRSIDIMLKTTPAGAVAAVDGVPIGRTPAHWAGEADGKEHEFTFTRSGYSGARFRFVPITSGVIHATLEAITNEPQGLEPMIAPALAPDAGVGAPPPRVVPPPTPSPTPAPHSSVTPAPHTQQPPPQVDAPTPELPAAPVGDEAESSVRGPTP